MTTTHTNHRREKRHYATAARMQTAEWLQEAKQEAENLGLKPELRLISDLIDFIEKSDSSQLRQLRRKWYRGV